MPKNRTAHALSLLVMAGTAGSVIAGPTGEQVRQGTATFDRSGSLTTITASDRSIIEYTGFDIGASETVRFIQPNASSSVLNRVLSPDPTRILGTLNANGRVYLVNPSGIIFGQGSVVNVGALHAAAASISDADFLAGVDRFTNATGTVVNRGTITASEAVTLFGARVANHGSISVAEGTVVMAAGERLMIGDPLGSTFVMLEGDGSGAAQLKPTGDGAVDMAAGDMFSLAAWNTGEVSGGVIHAEASYGRTVVSGELDAVDMVAGGTGGSIRVQGPIVELRGAVVDASGANGGGEVLVGGGIGDALSDWAVADTDADVRADATASGNGGRILFDSLLGTAVDGTLSATGGAGGMIETSSFGGLHVFRAPDAGVGGEWVVNVPNLGILHWDRFSVVRAGTGVEAENVVSGAALTGLTIGDALSMGVNVDITADRGPGRGQIQVWEHAEIRNSGANDVTLSLRAGGDIVSFGDIVADNGRLDLNLIGSLDAPLSGTPGVIAHFGGIDLNGGALVARSEAVYIAEHRPSGAETLTRVGTGELTGINDGRVIVYGDIELTSAFPGTDSGLDVNAGLFEIYSTVRSIGPEGSGARISISDTMIAGNDSLFDLTGTFSQTGGTVFMGADVLTTNDDILMTGDVILTDDVLLNAGNGGTPTVALDGTVDGTHRLRIRAQQGGLRFGGTVGGDTPVRSIHAIAQWGELGDVRTRNGQTYRVDTLTSRGGVMQAVRGGDIRVRDDRNRAGDLVLAGDTTILTRGRSGDHITIDGEARSTAGGNHRLTLDSGDGLTRVTGDIGVGHMDPARIGFLDVRTQGLTTLGGSVWTSGGMRFASNVEVNSDAMTFHAGDGEARFFGDVFSAEDRFAEATFDYDGQASITFDGAGFSQRVPVRFAGDVGSTDAFEGERRFGSVVFGGDLADSTTAASFVFSDLPISPEGLIQTGARGSSLGFGIHALDGVSVGLGQTMTVFGPLEINAENGAVLLSDTNVLGNAEINAGDGIFLRHRDPKGIAHTGSEADLFGGDTPVLLRDQSTELIVLGDLILGATLGTIGTGAFDAIVASANVGSLSGMSGVKALGLGSLTSEAFKSVTVPGLGLSFAYDLAITAPVPPVTPEPPTVTPTPVSPITVVPAIDVSAIAIQNAQLGLALGSVEQEEADFDPEFPTRILRGERAMTRLGMAPRSGATPGQVIEREFYTDTAALFDGALSVTLERLSFESGTRLDNAVLSFFDGRTDDQMRAAMAGLLSGSGDRGELAMLRDVWAALESLELTAFEIERAKTLLLERVTPVGVRPEDVRVLAR